jgi:hypothetical protein
MLSRFLKVQELHRCVSVLFTALVEKVDSVQKCIVLPLLSLSVSYLDVTTFCINTATIEQCCRCYRSKIVKI